MNRVLIATFLLLASSCTVTTIEFYAPYNGITDTKTYNKVYQISREEVTVREWITYMICSVNKENADSLFLGDYTVDTKDLLPDYTVNGWCKYVIEAFLRREKENTSVVFGDERTKHTMAVILPVSAWDTINKFKLLDLPVVGITHEQALRFVQYKQNLVNKSSGQKNALHYEAFLPTPAQFDSVQTMPDSVTSKKCPRANYKNAFCLDCPQWEKFKGHIVNQNVGKEPVGVSNFIPDNIGLYDVKGNVAEMTSVKGIAKGGSCAHYASEAYSGKSQSYSKPEIWLGLRVWYRYSIE